MDWIARAWGMVAVAAVSSQALDSLLVWSDEFDRTGLPDSAKWGYDTGGTGEGNSEAEFYTKARLKNAHCDGSHLVISAIREDTGTCWYGPCRFTSARLLTKGKVDWLYGRVDVSAQLPSGAGVWPAIWMLPTQSPYGGWPDGGEMDIMENIGSTPTKDYATLHFHGNGQAQGVATSSTLSSAFHLYSLVWRPDSLFLQFDDATILKYANTGDWQTWPFDQRFFLILNFAVGGTWPGAVDTANFGQKDFLVDYVRVWKFAQGTGPFSLMAQVQGQGGVSKSPDLASYPTFTRVALVATPASGWRFDHWAGGNGGTLNPDTEVVAANDTLTAVFLPAGERIGNGNFAQGLSGWSWWSDPTVGGGPTVVGHSACLHPASVGASNWMAQFSWLGLSLRLGEVYDLNFSAQASSNRPLQVGLVQDHDPFGTLSAGWNTTVGTAPAHFSHTFATTATESVARLEFDFGTDTSTLCLDSVSLVLEGDAGIRGGLAKTGPNDSWTRRIHLLGLGETTSEKNRDPRGRLGSSGSEVVLQPPDPSIP
jgi:beta-glucanase (GH16 family)